MTRILTKKDFKEMLWRNGQGVTTELYCLEFDGVMQFRISTAIVAQSGPFSDFTGYDRSIVNLGPGTMTLMTEGLDSRTLGTLDVEHFDGGAETHCEMTEACRDLNVFCAKDQYFASTISRTLTKPEFIPVALTSSSFIYVVSGSMVVQNQDKREFFLQTGEAILREASDGVNPDRWMLASASQESCHYVAVVFHRKHLTTKN